MKNLFITFVLGAVSVLAQGFGSYESTNFSSVVIRMAQVNVPGLIPGLPRAPGFKESIMVQVTKDKSESTEFDMFRIALRYKQNGKVFSIEGLATKGFPIVIFNLQDIEPIGVVISTESWITREESQ